MNNLCYHPPDSPQSFRGVKTVAVAMARIQRFLDAMTLGGPPQRVTLEIPEPQTEALLAATRSDVHADHDESAAYLASGQQPPELADLAAAALGPGEHRTCGSGWTGDLWQTRWTATAGDEGFAERAAALIAFADEHFGAAAVPTCWDERETPKRWEPALSLTASWDIRWCDPDSGQALPTQWDGDNTLWLFVGHKPQFCLDVAFPFSEVDASFARYVSRVEQALGAKLRDNRVKIRHGDPANHVWGFWLTSFDRKDWA